MSASRPTETPTGSLLRITSHNTACGVASQFWHVGAGNNYVDHATQAIKYMVRSLPFVNTGGTGKLDEALDEALEEAYKQLIVLQSDAHGRDKKIVLVSNSYLSAAQPSQQEICIKLVCPQR